MGEEVTARAGRPQYGLRVCHLSTVHQPYDVRIFHRQARTLAAADYEVFLVVHAGFDHQIRHRVNIRGVKKPLGRMGRFWNQWKFYYICRRLEADIYHFHDLELLPLGLWLKKRSRAKVIYDCHENYSVAAFERAWYPGALGPVFSRAIEFFEPRISRRLDAVVCVVPEQERRFANAGCRTALIRNAPILEHFQSSPKEIEKKEQIVYLGGLSLARGAKMMVDIMVELAKKRPYLQLLCLGSFNEPHIEEEVRTYAVNRRVAGQIEFHPPVDHEQVAGYLFPAKIGLLPWQPNPQLLKTCYPNKAFEYMACSLPMVVSDLAGLRSLIASSGAAIVVPAGEATAHARAIESLLDNPEQAAELGKRGREFILREFNWERESARLLELYANLSDG